MHQNTMDLQRNQNRRSQPPALSLQEQMVSHIQSQPPQSPPQHRPQQSNSLQSEMPHQQRLPASGSLLQQQQHQKQLFFIQSRRANPEEAWTTRNVNGGDWREEVYQKIKSMKDTCLVELKDLLQRTTSSLQRRQRLDALPQQQSWNDIEKLEKFRLQLECLVRFLCINKSDIKLYHMQNLFAIEDRILNILDSYGSRRSLQPRQLPQPDQMPVLQNPQPQVSQSTTPRGNQIYSQMQTMVNRQNSMMTLEQNSRLSGLQHNSLSSVPPVSSSKQNFMSGVRPASFLEKSQGQGSNDLNQLQQSLHEQQLKQQHPPPSQLLSGHQMTSTLHQMTDSVNMNGRQQMGVKSAIFQHPRQNTQCVAYDHQLKSGSPFPVSPPQVVQAHSLQVPPHPFPNTVRQNLHTSTAKAGAPLQAPDSPFVTPSPFTPLTQSPMPRESEKLNSCLSPQTNAGNTEYLQISTVSTTGQSMDNGTPGMSASPLLEENTSLDAAHVNAVVSSEMNVVQKPFERLIKAVKSASQKTLTASVDDIRSIISMVDRISEPAPGNGYRVAVGEDLAAMSKCHLHARNVFTQDGPAGTKRMRRSISAMPYNAI